MNSSSYLFWFTANRYVQRLFCSTVKSYNKQKFTPIINKIKIFYISGRCENDTFSN